MEESCPRKSIYETEKNLVSCYAMGHVRYELV